jgi:hypothetical protein
VCCRFVVVLVAVAVVVGVAVVVVVVVIAVGVPPQCCLYLSRALQKLTGFDYLDLPDSPVAGKGSRRALRDYGSLANLTALLSLVKLLTLASLPPSGKETSAVQAEPRLPLSAVDAEMLSHPTFCKKLVGELCTRTWLLCVLHPAHCVLRARAWFCFRWPCDEYSVSLCARVRLTSAGVSRVAAARKRTIAPIITHLCWEDGNLSNQFISAIVMVLREEDYEVFKPFFRGARILVSIADELQVCATACVCSRAVTVAVAELPSFCYVCVH